MDGITVTIDASMMGLLLFIVYKLAVLEMRLKKIEELILSCGTDFIDECVGEKPCRK